MRARSLGGPMAALSLGVLVGCSMVVDVERFHENGSASKPASSVGGGQFLDLKFTVMGMKPHLLHTFEYRVIDANNLVQSRGVMTPLGTMNVSVTVPKAIPKSNGPYRLDFYADVNGSGGYDGIGSVISQDHAWRIDPLVDYPAGESAPIDGTVQVVFTHSTSFTDIDQYPSGTPNKAKDTGLAAVVHFVGMGDVVGKLLEARVAEKETHHTVALGRIDKIKSAAFDLTVPGVVDVGVDYEVSVYVDANGNDAYDNPSQAAGDLGYRLTGSSTGTGLSVALDGTLAAHKEDVGAP